MCGICGVFHSDRAQRVNRDMLVSMNRQIVHRGPDDDGFFVEENVGLAMRRLSIIDIQTGHQPLSNEDGSVWIVFNGEIYNHQDLRKDLQSRGHRYRTQERHRNHRPSVRGIWKGLRQAFARNVCVRDLGPQQEESVSLRVIGWGSSLSTIATMADTLLFGSEIKAILAYPGVSPSSIAARWPNILPLAICPATETYVCRDPETDARPHPYLGREWPVRDLHRIGTSTPQADERRPSARTLRRRLIGNMLEECVSSHLMSDVPLGVFLSGGLDSSAVAALTTKIRKEPIETFSVGYGEEHYSELPYARTVAEHIESKHHEVRFSREEFFSSAAPT